MKYLKQKTKRWILILWLSVILSAFYLYLFENNFILEKVGQIRDLPLLLLYVIYLFLGCIRGFTLIPTTYLILIGLVFLTPTAAFILTMIGVMVSSASIYYFSEYLELSEYFEKNHSKGIAKLTRVLEKNELPIVIAWSFFPLTPTDLMCYVCGSLKVDIRKFLLGVFVGEGVTCALYIYLGKDILLFAMDKLRF